MSDRVVPILIVGAGPCGLGSAHRLHELNQTDFLVVEAAGYPGGLATSFVDDQGFTWDIGGHVVHSHYDYFDRVFTAVLGKETHAHQREAWVWLYNRFIPYPFQNNLRHLPKIALWHCVSGLLKLSLSKKTSKPKTFRDWILQSFGEGIAKHFLFPYNQKMWCQPLEIMSPKWVGDRVANVDIDKTLENILLEKDDVAWGPNHVFYFPSKGGTGELWRQIAETIPKKQFQYHTKVVAIDATAHKATLSTGETIEYQHLVSTMPLSQLHAVTTLPKTVPPSLQTEKITKICRSSTVHVVGIGLEGKPSDKLKTKCWMYYPESDVPFFRVTVFSNYSPANVPDSNRHWSLMCEVSESDHMPLFEGKFYSSKKRRQMIIDAVIEGLKKVTLIEAADKIISTWHHSAVLGYPTPTLDRDLYLDDALHGFEKYDIYSRGRFGAWKYEVSNMDHTFMQGVEVVNRIIDGDPNAEMTLWHPEIVNKKP